MRLNAVDAVTLGVEDLDAGKRFYANFGLDQVEAGASHALFETLDGTTVHLRTPSDSALPVAVAPGSTIREIIWGVSSAEDIAGIADELSRDRKVVRDADGTLHSTDDDGYGIAFRVERRRKITPPPNLLNIYGGAPNRPMNSRVDFLQAIRPLSVAHVVIFSPDVIRATRFYTERLQFRVSDLFKNGMGVFLRSSGSTYHHNLFLIKSPNKGLHHIAFPVADFNQVVLGGSKMLEDGWETKVGPGRHRIGSNFFWYFNSPMGGAMELTADMDRADDNWAVKEWDFAPHNTAAWSTVFSTSAKS